MGQARAVAILGTGSEVVRASLPQGCAGSCIAKVYGLRHLKRRTWC